MTLSVISLLVQYCTCLATGLFHSLLNNDQCSRRATVPKYIGYQETRDIVGLSTSPPWAAPQFYYLCCFCSALPFLLLYNFSVFETVTFKTQSPKMVTFSELESWPEQALTNQKTRILQSNPEDLPASLESVREWPNDIGVGQQSG